MKGIVKFLIVILVVLVLAWFGLTATKELIKGIDLDSFDSGLTETDLTGSGTGSGNGITSSLAGSSFDTAVVIEAKNEGEGLSKEHEWLGQNACIGKGGELEIEEELIQHNGSWFDIFRLTCNNEDKETYYFNVDSFNGKWE